MRAKIFIVVIVLLSGCVGGVTIPDEHYYRLPPLPTITPAPARIANTLVIEPLQGGALQSERAILFVEHTKPLELQRYHYHLWAEPPPVLVQERLLAWLRSKAMAEQVVRHASGSDTTHLRGRLTAFERLLGEDGIYVRVAIEFSLQRPSGPEEVLRYNVRIAAANQALPATLGAFAEALDKIFNQLVSDLPN